MALSSLETLYPIVRKAQTLVTPHNVAVGPRLILRNYLSTKAVRTGMLAAQMSGKSGLFCKTAQNTAKSCCALQQVRHICGRENCADPCDWPLCSPENLAKTDCMKAREERLKTQKPRTVYEVYWNKPECCANECIDSYPRFDDMYYRESDKENRVYTQTWCECPDMRVLPKPICCPDKIKLPVFCKRNPRDAPKTACGPEECVDMASTCPKIKMPCCRAASLEPCRKKKTPANCKKFVAPSPSFSECRKPDGRARKITECWCLAAPSMCQVWDEWRRLQKMKRVT